MSNPARRSRDALALALAMAAAVAFVGGAVLLDASGAVAVVAGALLLVLAANALLGIRGPHPALAVSRRRR